MKRAHITNKIRRSWCVCEKLMVVYYFEYIKNVRKTAKEFGIEPKQVRDWRKKKQELLDALPHALSLHPGRSAQYPILEEKLFNWVKELRDRQNA
ncbi:12255_t:CDS:1, partial [Racocetra fulgida]